MLKHVLSLVYISNVSKYYLFILSLFHSIVNSSDYTAMMIRWAVNLKGHEGSVNRKNNWDEIFGVFKVEQVGLKNSLSQSEGGGQGGGMSE
jgi:hypothetical protein